MADFDLVIAVVAKLRAVPALATPLTTAPKPARIFGGRVPPDAPFPRCYVRRRRLVRRERSNRTENSQERRGLIDVLFAATSVETADPEGFIEGLDALAEATLDYGIAASGLVYFRRIDEVPTYDQEEDRTTFYVGGGTYEWYRQVN